MGRVAVVLSVEDDGNVKVDTGGDDSLIADSFADGGDDSPPLAGDVAALNDGPETGTQQITGYDDALDGVASPGEKRIYSRDSDGVAVAEVYLKGDGSIVIKSLLPGGAEVLLANATDFVALAAKVDGIIAKLDTLFRDTPPGTGWTPVPTDGGLALQVAYKLIDFAGTAPGSKPASVAASKVKAE